MVLALSEETHEHAKENIYTPAAEVLVQAAIAAFFTGEAEELLKDKIHHLAESLDLTRGLVCHLSMSSIFTVLVTCFLKVQAKKAVSTEA